MHIHIYPEFCCETCNELIHNHMDCPACGEDNVETNRTDEINIGEEVICEGCKAIFRCVDGSPYNNTGEWIRL